MLFVSTKNFINFFLTVNNKNSFGPKKYLQSILIVFSFFLLWYSLLGYKLLDQDFIWDDFHLIRSFSLLELQNAWKGNWIPYDGIETPAYRPITTFLFHIQGTFFKENIILQRLFVFFLIVILICLVNILFFKIGFNQKENAFFSFLIIFSKIFTTLVAWLTLSHLLLCYIFYISTLIFLINYIKLKKENDFILTLIFFFLTIFTREEGYTLPFVMLLFYIYFNNAKISFKYFNDYFKIFTITSLIIISHYVLRKTFVIDAPSLNLQSTSFNDYYLSLKYSTFPGGIVSYSRIDTFFVRYWKIFNIFLIIFFFKKILSEKLKNPIALKNNIFFLTLIFICCLPNLVALRTFGIFLPTIFYLAIITQTISYIFKSTLKNCFTNKFLTYIILISLIISLYSFYLRSKAHLITMSQYSANMIFAATNVFFGPNSNIVIVPPERKIKQVNFLKEMGIYKWVSFQEILDMKSKNILSNKVVVPKYKPLDH
jgi:hypothetical protein